MFVFRYICIPTSNFANIPNQLYMYCYYVSMYYLKDTYLIILNVFFIIFWVMLGILQLHKSRNFFLDFGLFRHLTFWQEIFRHRHFLTGTFLHADIFMQEYFGIGIFRHHGRFGTGISQHWDISAQGYFSTWTFWHRYFSTNTPSLKCPCAKISLFQNVQVQSTSMVPKNTYAKMFLCWKVIVMKCPCQNVSFRNVRCQNKP